MTQETENLRDENFWGVLGDVLEWMTETQVPLGVVVVRLLIGGVGDGMADGVTVGMAVDANIIINERIREEIRAGKRPKASVTAGYYP